MFNFLDWKNSLFNKQKILFIREICEGTYTRVLIVATEGKEKSKPLHKGMWRGYQLAVIFRKKCRNGLGNCSRGLQEKLIKRATRRGEGSTERNKKPVGKEEKNSHEKFLNRKIVDIRGYSTKENND